MKPAIRHNSARGSRLAPVPFHDSIASSHDLAHGSTVAEHIFSSIVDYPEFHSRDRKAGHCLPSKTLFAITGNIGFDRREREHRRRLRQTVTGDARAP